MCRYFLCGKQIKSCLHENGSYDRTDAEDGAGCADVDSNNFRIVVHNGEAEAEMRRFCFAGPLLDSVFGMHYFKSESEGKMQKRFSSGVQLIKMRGESAERAHQSW